MSLVSLASLDGYTFFARTMSAYLDDDELCALFFTSRCCRAMVRSIPCDRRWLTAASTAWFRPAFDLWNGDIAYVGGSGLVVLGGAAGESARSSVRGLIRRGVPGAACDTHSGALRRLAVCRLRSAEKDNAELVRLFEAVPFGVHDNRVACVRVCARTGSLRALSVLLRGWSGGELQLLEFVHYAIICGSERSAAMLLGRIPSRVNGCLSMALRLAVRAGMPTLAFDVARRMASSMSTDAFRFAVARVWVEAARNDMPNFLRRLSLELGAADPFDVSSAYPTSGLSAFRSEMLFSSLRNGSAGCLDAFGRQWMHEVLLDRRLIQAGISGRRRHVLEQFVRNNLVPMGTPEYEDLVKTALKAGHTDLVMCMYDQWCATLQ
jgi:hypothetical protein